jgi:hypothetical protein
MRRVYHADRRLQWGAGPWGSLVAEARYGHTPRGVPAFPFRCISTPKRQHRKRIR